MYRLLCFTLLTAYLAVTSGHAAITAGPMLAYADMREAAIWVQGHGGEVTVTYWPADNPDRRQTVSAPLDAQRTGNATLRLGPLVPATKYVYELSQPGETLSFNRELSFTTAPDYRTRFPAPNFTIAIGGANYVNQRTFDPLNRIPGGGYEIYDAIAEANPQMMFWLGNTCHLREADWATRSGIFARYDYARSASKLQRLLSATAHIGVWGAHDYGPPEADRRHAMAPYSREAFVHYWPTTFRGVPGSDALERSLITRTRYSDVEFFILDDRTFRDLSPRLDVQRVIYGEEQIDWLLDELERSQATFKVVMSGSAILCPATGPGNATQAPDERSRLLDQLGLRNIDGLLFITGGKDFGEMTKLVRPNGYDLWELSIGPLTARPADTNTEINYFRVPSSGYLKRQFGLVRFSGPEQNRVIDISLHDSRGNEVWDTTIALSKLLH